MMPARPTAERPLWLQYKEQRLSTAQILIEMKVREPPVPIFNLVEWLDVHLQFVPSPGWDGAVQSNNLHADIWIDATAATNRQRFTCAHELGHLMLHPLGSMFRDHYSEEIGFHPPHEQDANRFAAAILMPKFMLHPRVYHTRATIPQIAESFGVSVQALSIRLEQLRRGPVVDP